MEQNSSWNASFIAPCGMNCGICSAYLRDKRKCLGCNGSDEGKPISCTKCIIKNCETIKRNESKLCYECSTFPCARLRQLDKRYRTVYGMSMIENLNQIKELGMNAFLANEKEKWTCRSCGAVICVHKKNCINCNEPRDGK